MTFTGCHQKFEKIRFHSKVVIIREQLINKFHSNSGSRVERRLLEFERIIPESNVKILKIKKVLKPNAPFDAMFSLKKENRRILDA